MSFFPPQACCLFLPIISASLKYFLEGSTVSAELKVPQWSDFSFSVFWAPHDQRCPATLGNKSLSHLFKTVRHQRTRQTGCRLKDHRGESSTYLCDSPGVPLQSQVCWQTGPAEALSVWILARVQSTNLQKGGRILLLGRFTYILLDGIKNRCQGDLPMQESPHYSGRKLHVFHRLTWHVQQPFSQMEACRLVGNMIFLPQWG